MTFFARLEWLQVLLIVAKACGASCLNWRQTFIPLAIESVFILMGVLYVLISGYLKDGEVEENDEEDKLEEVFKNDDF